MAVRNSALRNSRLCAALACLGIGAQANGTSEPQLAYLAVSGGYWEVWMSNADGTKARQVTHSKNDIARVSWFPDGTALLANRNDGIVMKVDLRGQEQRIPIEQSPVVDAAVSPDGKRLAFSFSTAIDGNDIWISNLDGTRAERLVRMNKLQHEPVWSPDGRQLYFLSGDGGQAHDVWKMDLNGRNAEQLTVGNLYHFDVAVSVTGDIAFSSNRNGNYEIYLQRAGKAPEALTSDPALDASPAFSPDGLQLVFESTRGGVPNLWRLDLKTRSLTQITSYREGARAPAWYQRANR